MGNPLIPVIAVIAGTKAAEFALTAKRRRKLKRARRAYRNAQLEEERVQRKLLAKQTKESAVKRGMVI